MDTAVIIWFIIVILAAYAVGRRLGYNRGHDVGKSVGMSVGRMAGMHIASESHALNVKSTDYAYGYAQGKTDALDEMLRGLDLATQIDPEAGPYFTDEAIDKIAMMLREDADKDTPEKS